MKGTVLDFNIQTNFGIIVADDEQRYRFQGKDWMESNTPSRGLKVDFVVNEEGNASEIYLQLGVAKPKSKPQGDSNQPNGFIQFFKTYEKSNISCIKKSFEYNTRASRSEFWLFQLAVFLIFFVIILLGGDSPDTEYVIMLFGALSILPNLAVTIRRLHDTGRSGWWFLITFIPILGVIVLFIFMVQESQPENNQWGDVPEPIEV